MNEIENIKLSVKVQVIYFQTDHQELGLSYATAEKRITIKDAEKILLDRDIDYKEILKVKYERITIILPLNDFIDYTPIK